MSGGKSPPAACHRHSLPGSPSNQPSHGCPPTGRRFRDYEDRQSAKERMSAERMAKAAAWEWEKEQAQHNKVC